MKIKSIRGLLFFLLYLGYLGAFAFTSAHCKPVEEKIPSEYTKENTKEKATSIWTTSYSKVHLAVNIIKYHPDFHFSKVNGSNKNQFAFALEQTLSLIKVHPIFFQNYAVRILTRIHPSQAP